MNSLKTIGLAIPFALLISIMVFVSSSLGATGFFTDSGQSLGNSYSSFDVTLGDVDGDGDLDAFVANKLQPHKLYENMKLCRCDLNQDGKCDMQDWLIFGKEWGETGCELNQIP